MRIKDQDFATGLMFALIGAGALWIGKDYQMGSPQRPGTGVLPAILSAGLIGIGGLLIVKALISQGEKIAGWSWRPVLAVTAGTIAFGAFIDELGLIVTMAIALSITALGSLETRWGEYLLFLAIMIALGWGMFIWLLGMPIPTWPTKYPAFLESVLR